MQATYDIAGFTVVLDKITLVSAIFEADQAEGWQFNVRFVSGEKIAVKHPDRARTVLDRDLLVQALNQRLGV
ncbi:MAG: hypothetical protein AAGH65_07140 [Pseudomonadota bacterium]